jgi:hypothetical protein
MRRSLYLLPKAIFLALLVAGALVPAASRADTISISPSTSSYTVGQTFTVRVVASSPSRSVNAFSGTVSFPKDKLQVVSVSKENSIVNLWVQDPTFSNVSGSVNFEGVVLNPGYTGSNGRVISVTFRAIAAGTAALDFTTAYMLANDGSGTNVLRTMQDGYVTIAAGAAVAPAEPSIVSPLAPKAPVIKSSTHPDQNAWYSASTAEFSWAVPEDVNAVRLLYDKNPTSEPTVLYGEPLASKKVEGLTDGEYYFHVQLRDSDGWGEVGHYRFRVDTTPPKAFKITFPHGSNVSTPQPIILFNTTDAVAGIDRYVVKVGEKTPLRVGPIADSNPYTLPDQTPGKHTVLVEAYDKAGNYSTASAEFNVQSLDRPQITLYQEVLSHDDLMKVRGVTYPNATVNIYIYKGREEYTRDLTKSNSLGDFSIAPSKNLEPGSYTFTVDVVDAAGARSLPTDPTAFEVKGDPVTKIISEMALYAGLGVIGLAVLIIFGFVFFHAFASAQKLRKSLQKDVDQMSKGVHKAFDLLREDVNDHVRALERAKSRRDLTKQEEKMLANLRNSLESAEKFLDEKIDAVKKDLK